LRKKIKLKVGDPRIYENSILAYVPEKNKIITPWVYIIIFGYELNIFGGSKINISNLSHT
jgi:hypothetical protein